MKILITGGAGFIGSHLVDALLPQGHQITVLDNFATARRDSLPTHPALQFMEGSIAERDFVQQAFAAAQPEVVIHAAASYKDPDDWYEDARTNVAGGVNVVQAAQAHQVQRLIYFQTSLCYGLHPLEQPITLSHPILPQGSSYAISKTTAEYYIQLSGLDFLSFRLANAYGPRNLNGPLPTFYQRLTQGKPCFVVDTRRDFIFIDDLVEVVAKAVAGQGQRGFYHISSGSDFAIKELFDATVQALGLPAQEVEVRPRNPDDVYTILLDPSKTESDFNWKTHTSLEAGVARAVAWFKSHGVTQTYTHLKHLDAKE